MTMSDMREDELADKNETEVREMLRGLNKVAAPANFDVRLRARLRAADEPVAPKRSLFGLGFALPAFAVLVLCVGGLFVFMRPASNEDSFVASVPKSREDSAADNARPAVKPDSTPASPANSPVLSATPTSVSPSANRAAASVTPRSMKRAESREAEDETGGGSRDLSVTSERPRLPDGFDKKAAPAGDLPEASYSIRDAFELNGIGAELTGGKWIVRTVRPNSVAAVSGVRVNDIVTAIDDHPTTGESITARTLTGNTLTVTRGAERLKIRLKLEP